jgi:Outer membrane protein beta-barrel domain
MFHRHRAIPAAAVLVAAALAVSSGPALAAKGQFSIGGNFGTSITDGGAFNDSLKASIGVPPYEDIAGDWDFGGSMRYGISEKASLDLEFNAIKAKGTSEEAGEELTATVKGLATSLNLYYALSQNESFDFNFFVGAGPLLSTKWQLDSTSGGSEESEGKTSLFAQAGLEGQYKVASQFALTARAMGRLAKADDVAWTDDPTTTFDVDMSGIAFSVGARVFLGGGSE